mmetsp:Transcript_41591/g.93378  ORF Transcript_41591/g.93378 Transcript_41591/m.93378 type:complete len:92 (+) Transcript_41591:33-308(+)
MWCQTQADMWTAAASQDLVLAKLAAAKREEVEAQFLEAEIQEWLEQCPQVQLGRHLHALLKRLRGGAHAGSQIAPPPRAIEEKPTSVASST